MNTISSLLKFIASFEPVGSIKMFAGASAPNKWLICDGSAVSRTTYSQLFSAIGTTYGAGDGSTTFNLPDFKGRAAIGAGTGTATDATAHALGSTGGAETHKLTTTEMPSHAHSIGSGRSLINANGAGTPCKAQAGSMGFAFQAESADYTGGNGAHNNMQPYLTVNYIIYAGV